MGLTHDFAHRDGLIEAAIDEFDRHGYAKASLNRILAAAGMSKGQFYHHFKTKEDLYLALVGLMIERKQAHFAEHPVDPADDVFEMLRAQLKAGLALAHADPQMERFSRSFLRERGRPIYATVMERYNFDADASLRHLVELAHRRGELTDAVSKDFAARALAHVMNGAPELLDASDLGTFEQRLDELITFLRRALGR